MTSLWPWDQWQVASNYVQASLPAIVDVTTALRNFPTQVV
jgi:hypothetical protein